ncbi:hypothetical protein AMS68_004466 [Peltaster fructicola]|uniref:Uncharacterized protein n=1 Tax=Peltaster fructicola TaxID=286661 RepID=A0A6H0XWF5_9PEZI|nr:hypothetical protein AMS68_004466 [Peltaster fructicola]
MRVAFVTNLVQLRALLASLTVPVSQTGQEQQSTGEQPSRTLIAVLDPISLHRPTSSFSAQGLNRTFALAIDAADVLSATLILCETSPAMQTSDALDAAPTTDDTVEQAAPSNPWDEDIGIVDIRTKTFGPGSRGWHCGLHRLTNHFSTSRHRARLSGKSLSFTHILCSISVMYNRM